MQPVTITDIDGDGNPDIFIGNGSRAPLRLQDSNDNLSPMMQFLMGRGDGTFVGGSRIYPKLNRPTGYGGFQRRRQT